MFTTGKVGNVDFEFVDQEKKWQNCVDAIKQAVSKSQMLALACEGESLSTRGKMQLLTIATRERSYILDIYKLQALPFERGLREILEDKKATKLMFDCREDADALFHQFHVTLDGVLDIQLLEIMKHPAFTRKTIKRIRGDHSLGAIYLNSLLGCTKAYVNSDKIVEHRKEELEMKNELTKQHISVGQVKYEKEDVMSLFRLFDYFNPNDEEIKRLNIASHIHLDLKRSERAASDEKLREYQKEFCDSDNELEREERKKELGEYMHEICEYERLERDEDLREYHFEVCDDYFNSHDEYGRLEINKELNQYQYEFGDEYCDSNDEHDRLESKENVRQYQYTFHDSDGENEMAEREEEELREYQYWFCDNYDEYGSAERQDELSEFQYEFGNSDDEIESADKANESSEYQNEFCNNDNAYESEEKCELDEYQYEFCDADDDDEERTESERELSEYKYQSCPSDDEIDVAQVDDGICSYLDKLWKVDESYYDDYEWPEEGDWYYGSDYEQYDSYYESDNEQNDRYYECEYEQDYRYMYYN